MKWCFGLRDDYNGFYCLNFVSSLIDKNVFLEVHVHVCFISLAMSIVGNPRVITFRYSPLITLLVNSEGLFRNGSISSSFHSNIYTIATLNFPMS